MKETAVEIRLLDKELYAIKQGEEVVGFGPPQYATPGSAAMDLVSAENFSLWPGKINRYKTGIAISIINDEICAMILSRSGLASKGICVVNSPGLIDSDYQGEIEVALINHSDSEFMIRRGDRIAQMLFTDVFRPAWDAREEFTRTTARGEGGFGSTGGHATLVK